VVDSASVVRVAMAVGGVCYVAYLIGQFYKGQSGAERDPAVRRLEKLRLWSVGVAFLTIVPLWASAYTNAPVWVVVFFAVSAAAAVATSFVVSILLGWREGRRMR
jgi:hypothetical protein